MDVMSQKAQELIRNENTLSEIVTWIGEGRTLREYSMAYGANHAQLFVWIMRDAKRREEYDAAVKLRDEYLRQNVIDELRNISTLDVSQAYDHNGDPLPMDKLPTSLKKSIQSIKKVIKSDDRGETITTEIKFFDKIKAINLLGKELGMFSNKVEVSGKVSLESLIGESFDE